eukprot:MONOS_7779.1-p1 / transcript=MONOS_7779.1 / gene=MONOS_7779 / organism=Monocercomonoides_exilis_PA203 / gene_product=unspecified product / transcript_product=unspecified product / location=Mono_scaffold00274:68361-70964(+) / protein_length=630 / sequence_SO=supercontig / SO=protein_coding / is_pseudo=false
MTSITIVLQVDETKKTHVVPRLLSIQGLYSVVNSLLAIPLNEMFLYVGETLIHSSTLSGRKTLLDWDIWDGTVVRVERHVDAFNISVIIPSGTVQFRVHPLISGFDVKKMIESESSCPVEAQRLLYIGINIPDSATLRSMRIGPFCVLHMLLDLSSYRKKGVRSYLSLIYPSPFAKEVSLLCSPFLKFRRNLTFSEDINEQPKMKIFELPTISSEVPSDQLSYSPAGQQSKAESAISSTTSAPRQLSPSLSHRHPSPSPSISSTSTSASSSAASCSQSSSASSYSSSPSSASSNISNISSASDTSSSSSPSPSHSPSPSPPCPSPSFTDSVIYPRPVPLSGRFSVDAERRLLLFLPSMPLTRGTAYRVEVAITKWCSPSSIRSGSGRRGEGSEQRRRGKEDLASKIQREMQRKRACAKARLGIEEEKEKKEDEKEDENERSSGDISETDKSDASSDAKEERWAEPNCVVGEDVVVDVVSGARKVKVTEIFTWLFFTEGYVFPRIESHHPLHSDVFVSVHSPLFVTLSQPITPQSSLNLVRISPHPSATLQQVMKIVQPEQENSSHSSVNKAFYPIVSLSTDGKVVRISPPPQGWEKHRLYSVLINPFAKEMENCRPNVHFQPVRTTIGSK